MKAINTFLRKKYATPAGTTTFTHITNNRYAPFVFRHIIEKTCIEGLQTPAEKKQDKQTWQEQYASEVFLRTSSST